MTLHDEIEAAMPFLAPYQVRKVVLFIEAREARAKGFEPPMVGREQLTWEQVKRMSEDGP